MSTTMEYRAAVSSPNFDKTFPREFPREPSPDLDKTFPRELPWEPSPNFDKTFPREFPGEFSLPGLPTSPRVHGLPTTPCPQDRGHYPNGEEDSPQSEDFNSAPRTHSSLERSPTLSTVNHRRSESEPRATAPKATALKLPLQLSQKLKSSFIHRFNFKGETRSSRKGARKAAKMECERISDSMDWTEE